MQQQKRENILISNASHGKFQTPPLTPPIPTMPSQPVVVVPVEVPIKTSTEKKEETSFTEQNGDLCTGVNGKILKRSSLMIKKKSGINIFLLYFYCYFLKIVLLQKTMIEIFR